MLLSRVQVGWFSSLAQKPLQVCIKKRRLDDETNACVPEHKSSRYIAVGINLIILFVICDGTDRPEIPIRST